ncbi:non-ribosomal peptide synthetase [Burkholderia ubonensis]|uniref:non-ribosomal peptide synthetase n=1 Tax=Burkholderia ubonensis TaxID=101571 RepID=UPI0010542C0F|nr:non-ribosomal peptide synthetase [Burkholderia ubonensis]
MSTLTIEKAEDERNEFVQALCAALSNELPVGRLEMDQPLDMHFDSAPALQALAKAIRQSSGVAMTPLDILKLESVRALAEFVIARRAQGAHPPRDEGERDADAARPAQAGDGSPVSFAQEDLWLVDEIEPGSAAYNLSSALRFDRGLNAAAMRDAIGCVVARHPALRTTFRRDAHGVVQCVDEEGGFDWSEDDIAAVQAPQSSDETLHARLASFARLPFDLARGPLLRVRLYRLAPDVHVLQFVVHHIVFDGMSRIRVVREIEAAYEALARGETPALPEPGGTPAAFAASQRQRLDAARLDRLRAHWASQLDGMPQVLDVPTDYTRPPVRGTEGAQLFRVVPAELADALAATGRRSGATLFVTLLAAFQVLLWRHARQSEFGVGVPMATRDLPEYERTVGYFVNTVVIRARIDPDERFADLLRRVADVVLDAHEYKALPFGQVVELMKPERSLSRSPLFQAMFEFHNERQDGRPAHDGFGKTVLHDTGTAKYDLSFELSNTHDGLVCTLEYMTSLFDRATIAGMLASYEALLRSIAAAPDEAVSRLSCVPPGQDRQTTIEWNDTARAYATGECIHDRFAARARSCPEATAVHAGDAMLSYRELDARTDALAAQLRGRMKVPGDRIAICVERSPEMIVAILAVLKAGAAYVPIDPRLPAQRIDFMLDDSGATLLVTDSALAETTFRDVAVDVLRLDAATGDAPPAPGHHGSVTPDLPAYVMYTSGSTGTPKGVVVTHANVVNLLDALEERYPVASGDRYLLKTNYAFDVSVPELFGWFVGRGSVVVLPAGAEGSPDLIAEAVARGRVTHINFTPSMLRPFVAEVGADPAFRHAHALKYVFVAGEDLPRQLANDAVAALMPAAVENLYGPTEATVFTTAYPCRAGADRARTPIGRPLANVRTYVLDEHMRPAPVGVPGDLYIAGLGVASGYLNLPALTRERFVDDPFGTGGRLYRTGDLARWRTDGEIEFLGREDHQVKIRGLRIELDEIENALTAQPGVLEAAVTVRTAAGAQPRIVACVALGDACAAEPDGQAALARTLNQALKERLPEYMAPGAYVFVDRLPKGITGKLDRKALASLQGEVRVGLGGNVAPRNACEAALCAIWREVLGAPELGVTDNFFVSGGDSILSIQIAARAREQGMRLSARDVFLHQTIEALAARIGDGHVPPADAANAPHERFALARLGPDELAGWAERFPALEDLYPATGIQLGMVFHSLLPGHADAYTNQSFVTFDGNFDPDRFKAAWQHVIDRHPVLRTGFADFDRAVPLQFVLARAALAWRDVDHAALAPDQQRDAFDALRVADKSTPFDFARPPLMRFALVRLGAGRCRFLWTYHHSILDGWSITLVWQEVFAAYGRLLAGRAPELPAATPFSDVIRWRQRQPAEAAKRYWRETLADAGPAPALRIEQQGLPRADGEAKVRRVLDEQASQRLEALARTSRVTLAAAIQAAWALLLHRYGGAHDVVFGITLTGRTMDLSGVERTVGPLLNTVPARIGIDPGMRVDAWLRVVHDRQVEREAHAHLDLIDIQRESGLRGDQALFDSVLIVDNYPDIDFTAVDGLGVSERGYTGETHYGLTVTVVPGARLRVDLEYDALRFHREDINVMADKFQSMLAALPAVADQPVMEALRQVDAAPGASGAGVSRTLRQGDLRLGRDLVPQLVENHAHATPDALALVYNDARYTYAELNRAANRLANHLLDAYPRLGTDSLIGVRIPRGDKLIITILAIWKAGAAYIPIDPVLPDQRVRDMLEPASASLLITDTVDAAGHAATIGIEALAYDAVAALPSLADENPDVHLSGNDLSYVLYTSGSTGKPKGAMVEHIGMLNNIANKALDLKLSAGSRVAQNASMSFDVSVWQMFIALTKGGTTVVYDDRAVNDIAGLIARLGTDGITVLEVVPTYLLVIVETIEERFPGGLALPLECLLVTGETIDAALLQRWFRLFPATTVVNAYGPTEASDDITHHLITASDRLENPVPIGRALANFDIYIVDDELRPVPFGTKGEIVVTGVGVGRGYVGMAGATAKAFVESPFPDKYKKRLYRTGDIGVMQPDGLVFYHGRKDKQVKIRGMRIELEEVELTLRDLPAVRQAAVFDVRPAGREAYLCAFVVPRADEDRDAIVRELKDRLPPYMVPSVFRFETQLPQLASGKIDRPTLLARLADDAPRAPAVAPRTELEHRLVDLWREVLGDPAIGIRDDFFEVGGDSFKAIRIAAKFGAPLEVTHIYDYPTIEALAPRLEAECSTERRVLTRICGDAADADAVFVCIANSGGGPVSFIETGRELAARNGRLAAYAVNLPRNEIDDDAMMVGEVERLTAEVCDSLAQETALPIVVFAQCNGSALAISIARELTRRGADLRALCIGGALLRTEHTRKDTRSDETIVDFLRSLGATLPTRPDEFEFFMQDFRYDCSMADAYYNHLLAEIDGGRVARIGAPIFNLVGTLDAIVPNYRARHRDWTHLSDDVQLVEYPGVGHYLLRDCPDLVADTLCSVWKDVRNEGGRDVR